MVPLLISGYYGVVVGVAVEIVVGAFAAVVTAVAIVAVVVVFEVALMH